MSELPSAGDRVVKVKPKVDWPGTIEDVQEMNGETYFHVRFDDPGLDDEYLLQDQFIMEPLPIPKAKSVWPIHSTDMLSTTESIQKMKSDFDLAVGETTEACDAAAREFKDMISEYVKSMHSGPRFISIEELKERATKIIDNLSEKTTDLDSPTIAHEVSIQLKRIKGA